MSAKCAGLHAPDALRGEWRPSESHASAASVSRLRQHIANIGHGALSWMGRCDGVSDATVGNVAIKHPREGPDRTLWTWSGHPTVAALNESALCDALRVLKSRSGATRGLLFVGDSLTEQHFHTLAGLTSGARFCDGDDMHFKRNDFLTTAEQRMGANGTSGECAPFGDQTSNRCSDWASHSVLHKSAVIVLSQGAHFIDDEAQFVRQMERVVAAVQANARPGALVVYRDSVPGVSDCDVRRFDAPLASVEQAEALVKAHGFYDGPHFKRRNEVAARVFDAAGFVRLHAYLPTVMRQDSRLGYRASRSSGQLGLDCIHFCVPGPTTLWADMLARRVVQAAACGYGSSSRTGKL